MPVPANRLAAGQAAKTKALEESRVALAKIPNPTAAQVGQLNTIIAQQQRTPALAPTVTVKPEGSVSPLTPPANASLLPENANNPLYNSQLTGAVSAPVKPTPPDNITDVVKLTYAEQADSQEKGSYLEYADTFKRIMGTDAPFKDREGFIAWRKGQNASDLEYLDKQQDYSRQIEGAQFQIAKEQATGASAATSAQMAQGREGAMSGTAPVFVKEFKEQMNRQMQMLELQKGASENERQKQLADLKVAQQAGDMNMVDAISGRISSIESELRQNDSQQLQIATLANEQALEAAKFEHSQSMDTSANYRANLGMFGDMVNNGAEMTTSQIAGMSKSLDIPMEVAAGYYEGAKMIRATKGMNAAQQELALKDLAFEFNEKVQGIRGAQAQAVSDYTKLAKSGNYSQEQLQSFATAMNIPNSMNPQYQLQNRIDTANATIKEYEAMNLGKGPKEGTAEWYELEATKLKLRADEASYKDFSGIASETDVKDIFFQKGTNRSKRSKIGGDNIRECGEGYNDITDGPNVGDGFNKGPNNKMSFVTKKDNPEVGNGLVFPRGGMQNGHIETVVNFNPITQSIQTVSWNRNGDGKQTVQNYTIAQLNKDWGSDWGFTDSKLKDKYASKLGEATKAVDVAEDAGLPQEYSWVNTMMENTSGGAEGGKAVERKQQAFAKAMASGDTTSAKSLVTAALLDGVTATERTAFSEALSTKSSYAKLQSAFDDFKAKKLELGLTGNAINDVYKAMKEKRPAEAVALDARLTQAFNQYRKAITGAGASTKEIEMLGDAFPSFNKNIDDLQVMIDTIKSDANANVDKQVNMVSKGMFTDYADYENKLKQVSGEGAAEAKARAQKQQAIVGFFQSWMSGNSAGYSTPEDLAGGETDNYIDDNF